MKNYTSQNVIDAVKSSSSIREILLKLNLHPTGGNYTSIKNRITKLQLDTSHLKGQSWRKHTRSPHKRSVEDYLSNKYPVKSDVLKKRLIEENILLPICNKCKLSIWLDQLIPLQLHHIDGNNKNNNLDNLELLCSNCHSLTDNYAGKNIARPIINIRSKKNNYSKGLLCKKCYKPVSNYTKTSLCRTCYILE